MAQLYEGRFSVSSFQFWAKGLILVLIVILILIVVIVLVLVLAIENRFNALTL